MLMAIRLFRASAAGVVLLSATAAADVKAVYHADGKETASLAVKGQLVRWTFTDPRGRQAMMYDNKSKVMTVIDHSRKQIVEMNEASIKAMRQQMEAMRSQMQAQLKNLPPEQRKMIEERMGPGPGKISVVAKKGKKDKVGGYPCRHYDMQVNGKSEQQVCVAEIDDTGVSKKDYKTLEGMFDFMQKMAESQGAGTAPFANSIKGIPVRIKEQRTGRVQTVKSIKNEALPDSLFDIPPYQRVDPFAPKKR
jgi:hypothetical protein